MMKIIMMFLFMIMIFNFFNKILLQLFYQNMIFFSLFMSLMIFPLNNMNFWMKMYHYISYDFYSMILIMLTFWIMSLMILMSEKNLIGLNYMIYINIMNLLLIILSLCFMTMNLIIFYMFFEMSLIPVFLLIMGWGFQIDRIQASFYMMLYTLMGSMPLFIMIIYIYLMENSLMMNFIEMKTFSWYFYFMTIIAFLIKMPMYLVHLWLPKAHVEAPIVGSMILAGIMLKLGSYGLMRFMLMMMNMSLNFNKFLIIISLMGSIYSSLICLLQIDMKMLVAYSSVVHMGMLMSSLMTLNMWSYSGSILMMIAHGLCSSGLFCLVNINYDRLMSRSLLINKGMINLFPSLSLMWFLLCSSNLSFPPSLNLFSEIMLFNSLILWNKNLLILMTILSFFSASYTLYLYSFTQHGKINMMLFYMKMININEYLTLMLHWIPLNILFIIMYMYI